MRLRISLFILLIAFGIPLLAACAQEQMTAEEIVARVEQARDAMQDVHATVALDFTTSEKDGTILVEGWLKKTDLTDDDGHAIYQARAEVLEASEADMVGSTMVSDGETFWLYNPAENKVVTGNKADMPERSGPVPEDATAALQDIVTRGLEAFDIELVGEDVVAGNTTWQLELSPTSDTEQQLQLDGLVEIYMWVDQERDLPLKMSVDASDMGQGSVEVQSITIDSGLPDDLFTFPIPEGAEVVDAADLAAQYQPQMVTLDEARELVDFTLLTPTSLPGEATLVEVQVLQNQTVILNYVGSDVTISVVQSSRDVGDGRQPPVGSEVRQVSVRGHDATLITGDGDQQGSLLSWQESDDVRMVIAGTLSGDEAVAVAESLE